MYRMSPIQPWLEALDKRPGERTMTDVQYVAELLRSIATLRDLPHELILDLASCAYLEDLEEGVTLFRQGDRGTNWYAVLSGSVSAFPSRDATDKLRQGVEPSCLWSGATFGESVLTDSPRHLTMVTREPCQLVRIEQRDFRKLWH
ncbi:rap guanine nucleotide exchange factor 4-like, partial [Amphibalanus amphitrite]|uniref:rap guanine nucleotide exchange factor 4-like n=1 Tax=Amphibalanus amphitrite TaxID=1232801 RepID=UPI001C924345